MSLEDLNAFHFSPLSEKIISDCHQFSCGNSETAEDLNDFFLNNWLQFKQDLFGKTYCFFDLSKSEIVGLFSLSNDSVKASILERKTKKRISKKLSYSKSSLKSYPAVLIGRLGRNVKYRDQNIGNSLLEFIKAWFIEEHNKTGCRYILVDAYNIEKVIQFYQENGFTLIFDTEEEEKKYSNIKSLDSLRTRLMYFDLITLRSST
ncbi:GNAT family N-acetyltransferase [Aquirufa nivalisilvae]